MSYKTDRYTAKDKGDEFEDITTRLASDLRAQIRSLGNYPVFSDPWCDMAEVCGRIASISDIELSLSASKSDGTLWETEEQALRFLIEDGKLNVLLRSLVDFKAQIRRQRVTGLMQNEYLREKSDQFEKGMGVLLKNAWLHVEVLQTTDIDLLVNHIADVLHCSLSDLAKTTERYAQERDLHQRQEAMVFYYLGSLILHIELLQESRVMPIIRERGIFMMAAKFLSIYHQALPQPTVIKCVQSLSLLVETEEFTTYRDRHVKTSDEDIAFLTHLKNEW